MLLFGVTQLTKELCPNVFVNEGVLWGGCFGVKQDFVEATAWGMLAAKNGNSAWMEKIGIQMDKSTRNKARSRANRITSEMKNK